MEKKIIITSNACLDKYDNKLNSFTNNIPREYLPSHKKWFLGMESFGMHCNFLNEAVSKNNKHPALIMFSTKYLIETIGVASITPYLQFYLDMFSRNQCYYLEVQRSLTLKEIHKIFAQQTKMTSVHTDQFIGFPTNYNAEKKVLEIGQFEFSHYDPNLSSYFLLHEVFLKHVEISSIGGKSTADKPTWEAFSLPNDDYKVLVDDQVYYWCKSFIELPENFALIEISDIKAELIMPKIIKIISPNVKPIFKNGSYCKEIGLVSLSKTDAGKYIHRNIESLQNFELCDENPVSLEIKLQDEFDRDLRLDFGVATFIKAHLSSVEMEDIHIKVSSHPSDEFKNNTPGQFGIQLAKKLQFFEKDWKISVSSVMHWNRLCYSSALDMYFRIDYTENEDELFWEFWVQNPIEDYNDVVEYVKERLDPWVKMTLLPNRHIQMLAEQNVKLTVGKDLALFLGLRNKIIPTYHILELKGNQLFTTHYYRRNIPLFPTHIYLYSSIVRPSLVGGGLHKLLKIIPLTQEKSDNYKTVEFQHDEPLPICTSEIRYINFELRSDSGQLIEFVGPNVQTYLNITFKNTKKGPFVPGQ